MNIFHFSVGLPPAPSGNDGGFDYFSLLVGRWADDRQEIFASGKRFDIDAHEP